MSMSIRSDLAELQRMEAAAPEHGGSDLSMEDRRSRTSPRDALYGKGPNGDMTFAIPFFQRVEISPSLRDDLSTTSHKDIGHGTR
jgi:hypothetical protein